MQEEAALQVTNDLYKRIAYLEKRVQMLEQKNTVYGPIPNMPSPTYELIPCWQRPDYMAPKIT